LATNPRRLELFRGFSRLGTTGNEQQVVGLQQRRWRLAIEVSECSRLGKRRFRPPPVNVAVRSQNLDNPV
jgi:hypothetical protein